MNHLNPDISLRKKQKYGAKINHLKDGLIEGEKHLSESEFSGLKDEQN